MSEVLKTSDISYFSMFYHNLMYFRLFAYFIVNMQVIFVRR